MCAFWKHLQTRKELRDYLLSSSSNGIEKWMVLQQQQQPGTYFVLDANNAVENNGTVTAFHRVQAVRKSIQCDSSYQRQATQCSWWTCWQLHFAHIIAHILEIHFLQEVGESLLPCQIPSRHACSSSRMGRKVKNPPTAIFSMREFHTHQPPHLLLYWVSENRYGEHAPGENSALEIEVFFCASSSSFSSFRIPSVAVARVYNKKTLFFQITQLDVVVSCPVFPDVMDWCWVMGFWDFLGSSWSWQCAASEARL